MRFQLRTCAECSRYTLKAECPQCAAQTESAHPAKFSPDDRYLKYKMIEKYGGSGD